MSLPQSNGESPKMTKAAAFLNSISAEESDATVPVLKPKQTNDNIQSIISPTASPIKKSERPLTSVQQMIKAKERETKENRAFDFAPRPDNKIMKDKKSVFVSHNHQHHHHNNTTTIESENDKLSKSEINRMGVINNAMSNSPSIKNLNKLKNIQTRLESLSPIPDSNDKLQQSKTTIPKTFSTKNINKQLTTPSSIAIKNWLDTDRDNLKLAAFVCRMVEIKHWIEDLLKINIELNDSNIDQFSDYLTNGILLAQIAQYFDPKNVSKVYTGFKSTSNDDKINYKMTTKQFKFTENIVKFLDFLRRVKLPSLFVFETNDLYEKKDIPKVIACLHALSCLMAMLGKAQPVNKLAEGDDVSSAILNLNVNVDKLKQIKYNVGRFNGSIGRKYVEGFDEAVRVNVGDDIRRLQLVELDSKPVKESSNVGKLQKTNSILETKSEEISPKLLDDISFTSTDNNDKSLLSLNFDKSDIEFDLSDINDDGLSIDNSIHTLTEPSSPDTPLILPPSIKDQEYTRDARLLFNHTSDIPSMPSVHSISEIQRKYQFLIDEDEREILGGSLIQSNVSHNTLDYSYKSSLSSSNNFTSFSNQNFSPSTSEEATILLQSLARGYLLRFDLFVTKAILKANTSSVISFQSLCRGTISRQKFKLENIKEPESDFFTESQLRKLPEYDEYGSSDLMKTILRNKKKHGELISNLTILKEQQYDIINLQSSIRAMFVREHYWEVRKFLLHEMNLVIKLQSVIRGDLIRNKIKNKSYFQPVKKNNIFKANVSSARSKIISSVEPSSKKDRVKSKRIYHAYDDQNPLKAPYDENELFEKFDIPTVSPKKKLLSPLKEDKSVKKEKISEIYTSEDEDIPIPGKVPRRGEARKEKAKYIPNLPIDEPTTPPREKRSISKLQHSPTKISLNNLISPDEKLESRLSSSDTVLFKDSKKDQNTIDDIITTNQIDELKNSAYIITQLQSCARGSLSRSRLNNFIDQIYQNVETFSNLVSISRGVLARRAYKQIRKELSQCQNDVILIQSVLRGIETRVDYDCLTEDIYEFTDSITFLQSDIRGFLIRKRIKDRDAYFKQPENLRKICRLQEIIRGLHDVKDYRLLIDEQNTPVRAVKKFIGLLGGLEADKTTRDEMEVLKLREEITVEKTNVREELDKLSKLKTKVEILRKNGIDIKNVEGGLRNNVDAGNAALNKIGGVEQIIDTSKSRRYTSASAITSNGVIIKKEYDLLNECIGSFFYILQTKPEYWARVLNYIEMTGDLVEFSHGHIEDWILKCFNYDDADINTIAEQTREECLYIQLIHYTFKLYLSRLNDSKFKEIVKNRWEVDIIDINYWELLLHAYLNLPQQRTFTKSLLDDAVFLITSDFDVRFECDPMKIFEYLIETTDKITESEKINVEVGNIAPLEIPIVEKEYIKNMQDLRSAVYEIFKYLKKIVTKFPMFIRCLCREFYESMKLSLNVSNTYYLGMIGSIFLQCFVLPIFQSPANYSIDIFAISDNLNVIENVRRNLELVSIYLNQCIFMKHFDSNKHPYLVSLNPFIDELSVQMKDFINELINVPLIEVSYRKVMLETSQENMFLKIQYDDIGELTFIWKEFIKEIFGDTSNPLYYSIKEIEEVLGNNNKKSQKKLPCDQYGFTRIKLVDNKEEGVEKIVGESMMLEVKKYLIYILQVQDGEDLVDLLVSEIEPADELKFKEIIKSEKKLNKKNYNSYEISKLERKSLNEIYNSSFPQVKKRALELIFELEKLNLISKSDGYQNLLNDIANEIRNKRKQQQERESEKAIVIETLTELKRRNRTYQKKYEEYEEAIKGDLNQRLMKSIQKGDIIDKNDNNNENKQNKAFLSKLFSKSGKKIKRSAQFIHGNKNLNNNSLYGEYKMSLKQLIDKGIIQSIGDNIESMGGSGFGGLKNSAKMNRINLIFKCNKPGYFQISIIGGNNRDFEDKFFNLSLDDLLIWQYEGKNDIKAFEGEIIFYCGGLLKYLLNNFYN